MPFGKAGRKRFFFEKKKQKTFAKLGYGRFHRHGLILAEVFLLLSYRRKTIIDE
jgi:hypothetical protein